MVWASHWRFDAVAASCRGVGRRYTFVSLSSSITPEGPGTALLAGGKGKDCLYLVFFLFLELPWVASLDSPSWLDLSQTKPTRGKLLCRTFVNILPVLSQTQVRESEIRKKEDLNSSAHIHPILIGWSQNSHQWVGHIYISPAGGTPQGLRHFPSNRGKLWSWGHKTSQSPHLVTGSPVSCVSDSKRKSISLNGFNI